jgi:membrane associated rhomboid family serine protease
MTAAASPMTEYIAAALICGGMLLIFAVAVVNISINLRRRPFNYKAFTAAGAVGGGLFTLGMVVAVWPRSVTWALALIGLAMGGEAFVFFYSRRLSRRYKAEGDG